VSLNFLGAPCQGINRVLLNLVNRAEGQGWRDIIDASSLHTVIACQSSACFTKAKSDKEKSFMYHMHLRQFRDKSK
jgi:hypothetical protein